ncbi:lipopolysaccharide biosynthesis protein [Riemerella anatipestifer]|nr:lipopolysaccharide biosynthesis protein [Riemerella anatipestifer]
MSKKLFSKSINGVIWTLLDVIFNKLFFFVVTILIARVVGPNVYGLMGMIAIFITLGSSIIDSGMSVSLIRTPEIDDIDKSTVFIVNIVMSICIYTLLYFVAPVISNFYKQPILITVLRVYGLIFIISAFRAVQVALNFRELNFRKNMLPMIPGVVISGLLGLFWAHNGYGIWSLVYMFLIQQTISTILLWISSDWKVSLNFSYRIFLKHFSFGYKLTVSGILNTTCNNVNNVLIGKFYPLVISGYYERAYSLNQYPSTVLTAVISRVSMPVLSKIQEDREKMVQILKLLMKFVFALMSVIMICMIVFADEFIYYILGKEWLVVVPYLQIISIASVFVPIHMFNVNVLQVYGKSNYFLRAEVIKKIFQLIIILILFNFGVYWLVSSLVFLSLFELYINAFYVNKILPFGFYEQFKVYYVYILLFVMVGSISFFVKENLFKSTIRIDFSDVVLFLSIILIYLAYILLFEKNNILKFIRAF